MGDNETDQPGGDEHLTEPGADTRAETSADKDDVAGYDMWVRPYTATYGRTQPSTVLDLMSLVKATGRSRVSLDRLGYEHALALRLCRMPIAVAEVAAHLRQPANVAKVLLSDLIDAGAVITRPPSADSYTDNPEILEALLAGLRNL
jgi:hypothetical protein